MSHTRHALTTRIIYLHEEPVWVVACTCGASLGLVRSPDEATTLHDGHAVAPVAVPAFHPSTLPADDDLAALYVRLRGTPPII